MSIRIVEPGPRTSLQDLGRFGWAAHGVPRSGAADPFALRLANMLAGNDTGEACLEFTLAGPTIEALSDVVVAVVGAQEPDGARTLRAGATLRIGKALGARGYVAVGGGFDVEPVMGSRSTCVHAGIGPPLPKAGDLLGVRNGAPHTPVRPPVRTQAASTTVRVVPGLHANGARIEGEAVVSTRADRVGVRFDRVLERIDAPGIPVGVAPGVVQLPPDGHPIILGPDGPVTGGYPQIAQVIAADLGVVGQAKPGDTLTFVTVDVEQARAALRARLDDLLA